MHSTYKNRRNLCWIITLILLIQVTLNGCQTKTNSNPRSSFTGTVKEITTDTLLVAPDPNSPEREVASQIYLPIDTTLVDSNDSPIDLTDLKEGMTVEVIYDGQVESGEIGTITSCYKITVLD